MKQFNLWRVLGLFCLLSSSQFVKAQNYQSYILDSTITYKWEDFSDYQPTELLALAGEDEVYAVPLPFGFRYFDSTYTLAFVGMNGYVSFGRNYQQSDFNRENLCMPVTQLYNPAGEQNSLNPDNFIAAFWSDLFLDPTCTPIDGGTPKLAYRTVGTAPNREFVVVWDYFVQSGDLVPCTTVDPTFGSQLNVELRLFEGTNVVEVHVKKNLLLTQDATIAVENAAGDYAVYANCGLNNPGDSLMAYRFTPSLLPPVAPVAGMYCDANGAICDSNDRFIVNVQLADLNYASGCSVTGYSDFTAQSANVQEGNIYQITVETNPFGAPGGLNNRVYGWIDWNKDTIFSTDEALTLVGNGAQGTAGENGLWTGLVQVPDSLGNITTRMRLRHNFVNIPGALENNDTPCGPADLGEVEDYHINVGPVTNYCAAEGGDCDTAYGPGSNNYDHILTATITNDGADLVNNSGCNSGYGDFTAVNALKVNWSAGNQYTITIKRAESGYVFAKAAAYVDWNQDKDFDDQGEEYLGVANPLDSTTVFTILSDSAQLGYTRLRIRTTSSTTGTAEPCGTQLLGEVEDYRVLISDPNITLPGCVSATVPADGATDVCNHSDIKWNKVAGATGYKFSLWYYSTPVTKVNVVFELSTTDTVFPYTTAAAAYGMLHEWIAIPFNADGDALDCDTLEFTPSSTSDPLANILPGTDTIFQCMAAHLQLDGGPTLGTSPYTHSWNGSDNLLLSDTAIVNPVFAGAASGNFRYGYTVWDTRGCTSTDSVVISIVPAVVGGQLNASLAAVCTGGATLIKHTGFSGNVQLQDSTATGVWADVNLTQVSPNDYNSGVLTQTTYYRAVVSAGSCADTSGVIAVVVNPNPAVPVYTASGPTTFCVGDSVTFTVTNHASGLVWNSASTTTATTATVKSAGAYFVTVTDMNGCKATSASTLVTTNTAPNKPVIQILSEQFVCPGDSVLLFTNNPNGDALTWSDAGATTNDTLVVYSAGTYVVTASKAGCSTTSDGVSLFFNANPAKPTIEREGPAQPCVGDTVRLISSYTSNISWNTGSTNDTITVTANGTFRVTYKVGNCISVSDDANVSFTPHPATPVISQVGNNLVATAGGYYYQWIAPSGPISGQNGNTITPTESGVYHVVIYTEEGCASTMSAGYTFIGAGLKMIEEGSWNIYPNPVHQILFIESGDELNGEITLVNMLGAEVLRVTGTGKTTTISLETLSPGAYMINYSDGTKMFHKAVMKN